MTLVGTVASVYGDRVVRVVYSKLAAKHKLRAWVQLLALCAQSPDHDWEAVTVGRGQRGGVAASHLAGVSAADAVRHLDDLVEAYRAGMGIPLPLPPKAAAVYAAKRRAGVSVLVAQTQAGKEWRRSGSDQREMGEFDDADHLRVWGEVHLDALLASPAGPIRHPVAGRAAPLRTAGPNGVDAVARRRDGGLVVALLPPCFDLRGALPTGTTVLEASAGTGKTYTIAGLAARYLAEGVAGIDEMMMVTFGRAATAELRDVVRERLVSSSRRTRRPGRSTNLVRRPAPAPRARHGRRGRARHHRLATAVANFDAATIATTHGFCHQMLAGLGIAADVDQDATFSEATGDLVTDVVSDLYVADYGTPPSEHPGVLPAGRDGRRSRRCRPCRSVGAEGCSRGHAARHPGRVRRAGPRRGSPTQAIDAADGLRRSTDAPARRADRSRHRRRRMRADPYPVPDRAGRRVPGHRSGAVGDPASVRSTDIARWCSSATRSRRSTPSAAPTW